MLTLNLNPIFKARGIERPYSFLVKAGFSPHSANNILHSETRAFKLDHIELLCKVLNCEPNDLLLWTPDKNTILPADHPLQDLKQSEPVINLKEKMATMPFKELKEITKAFLDQNKDKEE